MGKEIFIKQLKDLGYVVDDYGDDKISFPYEISIGRFKGTIVVLGFQVPGDFPLSPPSGPHIKPHLLPVNPNAPAHPVRVHESSPFGSEWQYWSRPFQKWAETTRTAKDYMRYIRHLFETQ